MTTNRYTAAQLKPWKAPKPPGAPTKKADKACYDLLHKAWRAGAIEDFRWGTDTNSLAVEPGFGTGATGWSVGYSDGTQVFTFDTGEAAALADHAVSAAGIESIEWGPKWCGYQEIIITQAVQEEAVAA